MDLEQIAKRYHTDAKFHEVIDRVIRIMEADKKDAFSAEELALGGLAAGVAITIMEEKTTELEQTVDALYHDLKDDYLHE